MLVLWYAQPPSKVIWTERCRMTRSNFVGPPMPPVDIELYLDYLSRPRPLTEYQKVLNDVCRITLQPILLKNSLHVATIGMMCGRDNSEARCFSFIDESARMPTAYRVAMAWQAWKSADIVGAIFNLSPATIMRTVIDLKSQGAEVWLPELTVY
jgi:hypothetical protein